ncbi:hypothetical protein [Gordonia lacunae]|uniref:Uncharacterized protein n=1 Tax=Gordonia lacunae TaxID=417102 RepID=A0A2C9ZJZ9_9ACTN|nr:hypothetical protein [Gordonia lacunae]OUC81078.1 hypothetical protein CA982_01700 [Gordonia lacunae]
MASHRRGTHRAVDNDGGGPLRRPSGVAGTSLTLAALSLCTVIPTAVASINATTLVHALAAPATVQVAAQAHTTSLLPNQPPQVAVGHPTRGILAASPAAADTLFTRDLPVAGAPRTLVIDHPQSIGPIIASGPRTRAVLSTEFDDETKERAVQQNLAVMTVIAGLDANSPFVVYTGDAQGSGGPGVPDGGTSLTPPPPTDTDGPVIVLVSDPRGPWSIRAWLETIPLVSALLKSLGRGSVPPRTERPVETPRTDPDTRGEPDAAEPPRGRPIEPNTETRDIETRSDAGTDAEPPRDSGEPRRVDRETRPDTDVDGGTDTPTEREDSANPGDNPHAGEQVDDNRPEQPGSPGSVDPAEGGDPGSGDADSESSDRSGDDSSGSESAESTA